MNSILKNPLMTPVLTLATIIPITLITRSTSIFYNPMVDLFSWYSNTQIAKHPYYTT
jgi:hypothetical protein